MATVTTLLKRGRQRKQIEEKLTDEQFKEYQDAFQTFDKFGIGYITTRELKFLLRSLGCNPTDFELQRIVNEVDADGNGKIDFPEFIHLMQKMSKPAEELSSTLEAFRVFDGEGLGFVHSKVIRDVIKSSLDQVSMAEIDDLIKFFDLAHDRIVSYEEFAKFIDVTGQLSINLKKLHEISHGHIPVFNFDSIQ